MNQMTIIDKLSIENNLSNSKIIGILVEEALSIRGIFNKKNGKATQSYKDISGNLKDLNKDYTYFNDNKKYKINTQLLNHKNLGKTKNLIQTKEDSFDIETYKKFITFLKFQEMMDEYNN